MRSGLLQYSDADELAVLPPSAVASVGPNGGNRYRKCDDLKSVTDSDNPGHPGLHQPSLTGRGGIGLFMLALANVRDTPY